MDTNTPSNKLVTQRLGRNDLPEETRVDESGQATAEYALLTGAIALILALVSAWATSTGKVAALLDAVFNGLIAAAG